MVSCNEDGVVELIGAKNNVASEFSCICESMVEVFGVSTVLQFMAVAIEHVNKTEIKESK